MKKTNQPTNNKGEAVNSLTLKWGTLKGWDFSDSERGQKLLEEYFNIGGSLSAMAQKDTPRQKEIIFELIDICDGEIWLDWEGKRVTKEKAKEYIRNYGRKEQEND